MSPASSSPRLSLKWLQLSGSTSLPGNPFLPSHVARTAVAVTSYPDLRRGRWRRQREGGQRHRGRLHSPSPCFPGASRFLWATSKQKAAFPPRAPGATIDTHHRPTHGAGAKAAPAGSAARQARRDTGRPPPKHTPRETRAHSLGLCHHRRGRRRRAHGLGHAVHGALTFMTLLRHSSATILTSDSASSLHSRKSSIAMPRSF